MTSAWEWVFKRGIERVDEEIARIKRLEVGEDRMPALKEEKEALQKALKTVQTVGPKGLFIGNAKGDK